MLYAIAMGQIIIVFRPKYMFVCNYTMYIEWVPFIDELCNWSIDMCTACSLIVYMHCMFKSHYKKPCDRALSKDNPRKRVTMMFNVSTYTNFSYYCRPIDTTNELS